MKYKCLASKISHYTIVTHTLYSNSDQWQGALMYELYDHYNYTTIIIIVGAVIVIVWCKLYQAPHGLK